MKCKGAKVGVKVGATQEILQVREYVQAHFSHFMVEMLESETINLKMHLGMGTELSI